ncbi:large ribosomal subunit protein mL66 [Achroia grisella]|uniref:large ribosomal subunit protein mL66 n=1 Tax=Achroia grisella TaxID=688607 RepID=UPI0027D2B859|nr:large ribosomal subunit protein mL66 [Achroia grisella]
MSALVKSSFSFLKTSIYSIPVRAISTTNKLNLKEIREQTVGSTVIIEGVQVPSPRQDYLIRADKLIPTPEPLVKSEQPPCYMCALGLDVKHTDVLILSQFVRSDGCMLPRRITGLCRRQQKKVGKMVTMAQKAGLMINMTPKNCAKDPKKRRDHKKFNTYFDESTIFLKRIPKPWEKFRR